MKMFEKIFLPILWLVLHIIAGLVGWYIGTHLLEFIDVIRAVF